MKNRLKFRLLQNRSKGLETGLPPKTSPFGVCKRLSWAVQTVAQTVYFFTLRPER